MMSSLLRSFSALAVLLLGVSFTLAEAPLAAPSLPLSFEQNQGQVAQQYPFLFRQNGTEALFLPTGVDLQFAGSSTEGSHHLGLRLLHESSDVTLHAELPLAGRTNYLLGSDAAKWVRGVPTFSRIHYTAVYPGVDLVFYGNDSRLEHDFRVAPGADASRIAFHLDGADSLTTTPAGDLHVSVGGDLFILHRPSAYQQTALGQTSVPTSFTVAHDGTITFNLGAYDPTRELVIDPALTYATYLDKLSLGVAGIATDSTGATYITGYTFLSTYGTTPGTYQTTCPACANNKPAAFITKLDPTGTRVVYSTFLGGSDYTQPLAITVGASGSAIIGGYTMATDFPLKNPLPTGTLEINGSFGFISSLSPDGSTLNFSTLFNGDSIVNAITAGPSGNVFLTGATDSSTFPVTPGALHAATPQYPDNIAFVTQLTPAGSLVFSALLGDVEPQNGGGGLIGVQGIAVDAQGEAYITGAAGTLWPTTPGAYQTAIPGTNPYDAPFVTKLSADGSHILFSTFLGIGLGQAIALDANNNINLLSSTSESLATYTSYLSQLSPDGSQLLHSTTLGSASGEGSSMPSNLAIDPTGNLWISGSTTDPSYPLMHPLEGIPSQSTVNPTGFLSEYDASATTLKFSTIYGGRSTGINGLAIDAVGTVHIAGTTISGIYTTPDSLIGSTTPAPQDYSYTYGYLALINPARRSAAVCGPGSLSSFPFSSTPVGSSAAGALQLTSCGELPLSISSIQSSSSLFTVGDPTADCGSSLAPGATCSLPITFHPVHSGNVTATLELVSNASIPNTSIALGGAGIPLPPTFSSASLTFTTTPGLASPTQVITMTNVSDLSLVVGFIGVSSPFTVSNDCPFQLAPGAACSITVGFFSATAGTFDGTLLTGDGSYGQEHTIALTGTAAAPSVTLSPTSPAAATQTVTAGQPATYTLAAASVGSFSGAATFSCTNLPQFAACSFNPSTVMLAAGASAAVSLTVTTKQPAVAALRYAQRIAAFALLGLPLLWLSRRQVSALTHAGILMSGLFALAVASSALLLGCGGSSHSGGTSPTQPTASVTPAGTYTITVSAKSTSAMISTPVTLVVH